MDEIKTLILSNEDWNSLYRVPANVNLLCDEKSEEIERNLYDVTIIDRRMTHKELNELYKSTKAYCVFFTDKVEMNEAHKRFMESRKGKLLATDKIQDFFDNDIRNYFPKPYGEKYKPMDIIISGEFTGEKKWLGYTGVELCGEFGEDFTQIVYWKGNIPIFAGQNLDMYLEYSKSESVSVKFCVSVYKAGAIAELMEHYEFDEEQLKDYINIDNGDAMCWLYVYIMASGHGTLTIRGLHDRHARRGIGHFLPGGETYRTSSGEEIFCYFDPADMKPPLNIYFSGFKTQEGFEGYYLLKNMGCPFLLVAEGRLQGGCFYMGDDEYEKLMVEVIKKYVDELGFSNDQVIMSGLSMGTTGAMYYSVDIRPKSVIIGKPLASIGDIAAASLRSRPGDFATSMDVLYKITGGMDEKSVEKLNSKFWDKFKQGDFSDTKFVVAYMIEDDYDTTAYGKLLDNLNSVGASIYGKGLHGRHNDNSNGIVYWFSDRYKHVMYDDYKRIMK